ncbi:MULTISPECIES: restriction endonuclease subunit S [unclassified Pseudomonas]|uniref:restriction endonuclease subunit S n=1 Tax=unclassified Pseudomonas TaxID=196821 RepID=UPI001A9DCCF7|nr:MULTISPECIES: restriction endonuclease subunit S [unclassified Pseudomonas]
MVGRYKPYATYKSSNIEWIGRVPEHWKASYLGFECSVKARLGWKGLKAEEYVDDGVVFLATPNIKDNEIDFSNVNRITRERYFESPEIMLEKGDVLVTKDGSTTGTTNIIRALPEPATVNSSIAVLRSKGNVLSEYLYYFFVSEHTQNLISRMRGGMGVPHLFQADLRKFDILIPAEREQRFIANFLDHETAKIDSMIEKQKNLIHLLKEKRQAAISHAVTKGFNPNARMLESGIEWLGNVPTHWIIKNYRYATKIYRGKFGHRPRNDPAYYDGDYPFIQTGDIARAGKKITTYNQTLNEKGISVSQRFPSGTLVMAIAANIGDTAILDFEAYAPDSVVGFRPNPDINLEFLRYSFLAALPALEQTSTQSTQANLNIDRVGTIKAAFPPLDEQLEIVAFLDSLLDRYTEIERKAAGAIQLMQERRTALISAAVTGKIDVRDWVAPKVSQTNKEVAV